MKALWTGTAIAAQSIGKPTVDPNETGGQGLLELFRTASRNTSRDQEMIGPSWGELWPFPLLGRARLGNPGIGHQRGPALKERI